LILIPRRSSAKAPHTPDTPRARGVALTWALPVTRGRAPQRREGVGRLIVGGAGLSATVSRNLPTAPRRLRTAWKPTLGPALPNQYFRWQERGARRRLERGNNKGRGTTVDMTNPDHLALLNQGVTDWNAFVDGEPSGFANLTRADLAGANLAGANLAQANLTGADLTGSDLTWATLTRANLTEATLTEANLTRANLTGATMHGVNLTGVNLTLANLTEATMHGANLTGSDLTGSDLARANLARANLTGANLTEARLGFSAVGNVDLRLVKGLDTVSHSGPSSVGIDTFMRSEGQIPDAFLLGCGVPDLFVKYGKDIAAPFNVAYHSAFLSHSSTDKDLVHRFYTALHEQKRIPCWLDEHQMIPGDDLRRSIAEGIRDTDKMILFCSAESLDSYWVDAEVRDVLDKEELFHKQGQPTLRLLVPVDVDGALFETGHEWSPSEGHPWANEVRRRIVQKADWNDEAQFGSAASAVANALRTKPLKPVLPPPKLNPNH